jgi:cell division protein FtsI (penicillin-binding protein 3)
MAERRPHPAAGRSLRENPGAGARSKIAGHGREPRAGGHARDARASEQTTTRTHRSNQAAGRTLRDGRAARTRTARRHGKKVLRVPLANGARRLHVVLIMLAMGLSLCAGRLLQLQGFDSSAYAAESAAALTQKMPLLPSRGDITDRHGTVLAATEPAVAVTADPYLTGKRPGQFADVIAPHLGMTIEQLIPLLTKPNTHFVYLKKKVPAMTYTRLAAELAERNLYGVFRESDPIRTYPTGALAGPIIGFVGAEGEGLEGLEYKLNTQLAGVEGQEEYESAPNGSRIPLGNSKITPAQNGYDYQLTLDSELQWVAQRRVAQQVAKTKADFGFAITMNIKTGEVLALAQAPSYDSNDPLAVKKFRSLQAVTGPYEPGSVQKVLTAAALIESGVAGEETRLEVPNRLTSGPYQIKDHFEHKDGLRLNMRGVIAKSSNIGTVMLARQLPTEDLHEYLVKFGLGARTGIELPGESIGILPGAEMSGLTRDRVAFGQGLAVTGIQEISAIAGLVNDGVYNPPTILKSATDTDGKPVALPVREPRRIASGETSAHIRDLMRAVVDSTNGQSRLRIDGYTSGGKTGTAQRGTNKGYQGYITSYIGFAPLNDPQIITYVVINNPRKGDSGSQVAAPIYRDIMQYALPRYSVEPTKKSILKAKDVTW